MEIPTAISMSMPPIIAATDEATRSAVTSGNVLRLCFRLGIELNWGFAIGLVVGDGIRIPGRIWMIVGQRSAWIRNRPARSVAHLIFLVGNDGFNGWRTVRAVNASTRIDRV
jgi:hypothetical protein